MKGKKGNIPDQLSLFGLGKLPELGKSLGRGIKEFKSETERKAKTEIILVERNDTMKEDLKSYTNGNPYNSNTKGTLGGHRKLKI